MSTPNESQGFAIQGNGHQIQGIYKQCSTLKFPDQIDPRMQRPDGFFVPIQNSSDHEKRKKLKEQNMRFLGTPKIQNQEFKNNMASKYSYEYSNAEMAEI